MLDTLRQTYRLHSDQISRSKVKSRYGYVSQLYVRGMACLHLIYHPVEA